MKKLIQIFAFCSVCILSISVYGQNCCSGGVPISGNLGLPAGDPGALQVSVTYDLNLLRRLKTGTKEDEETSIRRLRTTQSALVSAGYTISPRFAVEAFLSWVRQERTVTNRNTNSTNFQAASGVGDLVLMGKFFVLLADQGPISWQVGLGLKMPTGSFQESSDTGIPFGMDLQPGSGTWDGILWSRFSHVIASRPSMSLSATATYSLRSTNPEFRRVGSGNIQDWQIGDEFQLLVGIADRFQLGSLVFDPSISFRVRLAERDVTNGFELDNTGGEWVFWVPGFSLALSPNISWQATVDIPVYSRIKGTQLTPSFRLNTGIIFQFPTRKNKDPLNLLGK
ncbi:MAG: transporter [Bacteroidota bacterium]